MKAEKNPDLAELPCVLYFPFSSHFVFFFSYARLGSSPLRFFLRPRHLWRLCTVDFPLQGITLKERTRNC